MFLSGQLALLIETGNALPKALGIIARQVRNETLRGITLRVREDVESGLLLSDAMARHPEAFPPIYVALIQAGEASGQLKLMLERVAALYRKREAFLGNIRRSLAYPAFLSVFCCLATLFILLFVFPRFETLFENIHDSLPVTTRALMWLSGVLRHYWYLFLVALAAFWTGLYRFLASKAGRAWLGRLELRAPGLSGLLVKIYLSELATVLGFLLHSNVPLLEALRVSNTAMRNLVFKGFVARLSEQVEQGKSLSAGFLEAPFMPDMVKEMMVTADETGKVDVVLLRLGEHYDEEVARQLSIISALVEPLALLVMGGVVGLLVISLIIPITRLSRGVH
jgi:type II secretory pathway component PulF